MRKLLFVANTMGSAGAETAMLALMRDLLCRGYAVDLLSIVPRGEMFGKLPPGVRIVGKRYSCKSVFTPAGRAALFFRTCGAYLYRGFLFRNLGYLWRIFRAQRAAGVFLPEKLCWRALAEAAPELAGYDMAIAYLEGAAAYYVADRCQAAHKAAFLHIDYRLAMYGPLTDGGCYDRFDRIFAVSENVRDSFLSVYPGYADKTRVFMNLIDRDAILHKAELPGGFSDAYTGSRLLTVGRLHRQKAYEIAIDALGILVARGVEARWYVLGEGQERAALERQIRDRGLTGRFVLLGFTDNPYPYMRQCDLYVHATRFEGKSVAVEEAQVLGKPIVASDYPANREQITDGETGLLVPLTPEAVADAIESLLRDPVRRKALADASAHAFIQQNDVSLLTDWMEGSA